MCVHAIKTVPNPSARLLVLHCSFFPIVFLFPTVRGVQKQNSVTTTSDFSGAFEKLATREEFIRLISTQLH